jgi:hypothetical protein
MAHTRFIGRGQWQRSGGWGVPILALALGVGCAVYAWPFSVDDAFIIARYARRLAAGQGYTFQDGEVSDGVTGPLWLFLLAGGERLGVNVMPAGKLLGLAAALAACAAVLRCSAARAGGERRGALLGLLLASAAPLWIWSVGGLETGCATLCLTCVVCGAFARPQPRVAWLALGAGLMPWLRPELVPLTLVAAGVGGLRLPRARVTLLLACTGGLGSVLLFRHLMFGHLLPLSAHAKPASLTHGVEYLLICLRSLAALALLPLLAFGWYGRRFERALVLLTLIHACLVVLAGGDWMAGARLFVPIVPIACFAAALGWERIFLRSRTLALALACLVIALRALSAPAVVSAARGSGQLRERRLPVLLTALATAPEPIALVDIGALGFFGDKSMVDLAGLTDARIAYAPGGHVAKRIDAAYLRERAPGTLVLHSRVAPRVDGAGHIRWFAGHPVERHVLSFPWLLREYRVRQVIAYDRDYFYLVLTREAQTP